MSVWGWTQFFEDVSSLLSDSERQLGTANIRYIVERLQICMRSVSLVQSEIARATQPTEVSLLIIMCVIVSCTSMYDCVFVNTGWRT